MNNETVIEEVNDPNSGEVIFTVTKWSGRNFIYHGSTRIGECINGDYEKRYGGAIGWLKTIIKRERDRVENIESTLEQLTVERSRRMNLIREIKNVQSKTGS